MTCPTGPCPVCLSPLGESPSITLRCHHTHTFHTQCINSCLSKGIGQCPLCRVDIFQLSELLTIAKDISYGLAYGSILATIIYIFLSIGPLGLCVLFMIKTKTPIYLPRIWIMGLGMKILSGCSLEPYFRASIMEYIPIFMWLLHTLVIRAIAKFTGVRGPKLKETHKFFIASLGVMFAGLLIEIVDQL